MEQSSTALQRRLLMLFAGLLIALGAWPALADPPSRAARISLVTGSASFSPAGSSEWVQARVNRPIWIGDRLWSGDGRIELQLGGASLRLAPGTSLQVLNFDDRIAQFEVTQGAVALHVRVIDRDDTIEINTPTFAFVAREEGDYRIDVERDYTAVAVRRGSCDVYGQNAAYRVDRREQFSFYSADLRDYDAGPLPRPDAFDRWTRERAQREDRSVSARYVSPELVGYVDLDQYGEWRTEPSLGAVWVPRVSADWAPYRHGHWTWVDPWGWTWIDDAPWGYAPSHYGRWTRLGSSWGWVPGPRTVRPVYAPALVAWVGGENFSLSVSSGRTRGVAWFPLAPGEVWRPAYDVSREYFTRVNVSNTVINNTTVVNVYNNRNDVRSTNVDYRFRSAPAAVTAMPVEAFVQSQPVQRTAVNVNVVQQVNVLAAAPAQPVVQSIVGAAPRSQSRPPAESMQRQVVARTAPAAAVPTIENRAEMARSGKPLDREALQRVAPAQAAPPAPPRAEGAPKPPAGQPPAEAAPRNLGANVRVVEADKAQAKPLPPTPPADAKSAARRAEREDTRAARDADKGNGKAAGEADKDRAKGAATPTGQPPQAAQPGREASPPRAAPVAPAQPQPAQPVPAQPPRESAAPATRGDTQPGREASPPRAAPVPPAQPQPAQPVPTQPPRESAAPATRGETQRATPPAAGRPTPAEDRPAAPAEAKPPAPAAPPASPTAPSPRPEASPPNVDQLKGREQPARGSERPGGERDERRAQPVTPTPAPAAPPAAPVQRAPAIVPPPASPPPAAQPGGQQPPDDARRGRPLPRPQVDEPVRAPQAPQRAQEPPRPAAPPPPQSGEARRPAPPAPPAAQPAAPPPPRAPADARRPDREDQPVKAKGKGKDEEEEKKEKEKEKEKEKDKDKGRN